MKKVNLLHLSKSGRKEFFSYTTNMFFAMKINDLDTTVYSIGKKSEKSKTGFGDQRNIRFTTIRGKECLALEGKTIVTCVDENHLELAIKLAKAGAYIVLHNSKFSDVFFKYKHVLVTRSKDVKKFKYAKFVGLPYKPRFGSSPTGKFKIKALAIKSPTVKYKKDFKKLITLINKKDILSPNIGTFFKDVKFFINPKFDAHGISQYVLFEATDAGSICLTSNDLSDSYIQNPEKYCIQYKTVEDMKSAMKIDDKKLHMIRKRVRLHIKRTYDHFLIGREYANIIFGSLKEKAPKKKIKKFVLVTGTGRSGTKFMSSLMAKVGLKVGHEYVAEDGTSSSFFYTKPKKGVKYPYMSWVSPKGSVSHQKDFSFEHYKFKNIFHIVRDPRKGVPSIIAMLANRHIQWNIDNGIVPDGLDTKAKRALHLWCNVNEAIEKLKPSRFKLEDIKRDWKKIQKKMGLKPKSYPGLKPQHQNLRNKPKPMSWKELKEIDPGKFKDLNRLAKKYGYK